MENKEIMVNEGVTKSSVMTESYTFTVSDEVAEKTNGFMSGRSPIMHNIIQLCHKIAENFKVDVYTYILDGEECSEEDRQEIASEFSQTTDITISYEPYNKTIKIELSYKDCYQNLARKMFIYVTERLQKIIQSCL